jgi:glycerate-2-kinase
LWSCAIQLRGIEGGQIKRAFGENGLLALASVSDFIRGSLDQIGAAPDEKAGYDLTFPAHVPTKYGLKFHRRLVRRIDDEIGKIDKRDDHRLEERAVRFNEMLAILPSAARL